MTHIHVRTGPTSLFIRVFTGQETRSTIKGARHPLLPLCDVHEQGTLAALTPKPARTLPAL